MKFKFSIILLLLLFPVIFTSSHDSYNTWQDAFAEEEKIIKVHFAAANITSGKLSIENTNMVVSGVYHDIFNTVDWGFKRAGHIWRVGDDKPMIFRYFSDWPCENAYIYVRHMSIAETGDRKSSILVKINGTEVALNKGAGPSPVIGVDDKMPEAKEHIFPYIKKGWNTIEILSSKGSGLLHGVQRVAVLHFQKESKYLEEKQKRNESQLKTIFEDDFTDNRNNWNEYPEDDEGVQIMQNGKYILYSTQDYWRTIRTIEIDQDKDFEIESTIEKAGGVDDNSYDIIWGLGGKNYYTFGISGNGSYKYLKRVDGEWIYTINWTESEFINKYNAINRLKIKKSGDKLSFYINNQFVNETQFEKFFGNGLGIGFSSNIRVKIDDYIVRGTPLEKLETIFEDDFVDNRYNWNEHPENEDGVLKIQNGKYVFHNRSKKGYYNWTLRKIEIDQTEDFEIESTIKKVGGKDDDGYDIIWGSDGTNHYIFRLMGDGLYTYSKWVEGKWTNVIKKESKYINKYNSTNKLKLSKSGNKLTFYINDQFVDETNFERFLGDRVGFALGSGVEVEIDNLVIKGTSLKDNRPPVIIVHEPPLTRGFSVVGSEKTTIRGKVTDESDIYEVLVNGQEATVDQDGTFRIEVNLAMGENRIRIKATDMKDNFAEETFTLKRTSEPTPHEVLGREGVDYALLFATNQYDSWNTLINPINDAGTIADELNSSYGFHTELFENLPQTDILTKLREYAQKQYKDDDQLFIFFAGHGLFDEVFGEGFIVVKDSKSKLEDKGKISYISHERLKTIVNSIPCKHICLVLDVCFGGTFDPLIAQADRGGDEYEVSRTEFIQRKMKFETRRYLTSGGKEYVPDGRPGHYSPFAGKFLEALRCYGGKDAILTLGEILNFVEKVSPEPRGGAFGNNEPGSDFIFIAR